MLVLIRPGQRLAHPFQVKSRQAGKFLPGCARFAIGLMPRPGIVITVLLKFISLNSKFNFINFNLAKPYLSQIENSDCPFKTSRCSACSKSASPKFCFWYSNLNCSFMLEPIIFGHLGSLGVLRRS